ncbi:unnamed protein product [Lactuca saligna]|uniref:Uncharacterized protein n=1 Tax=Lactuca saligna TaxID=75948 RepID=A0AA36EFS5_LACSI|nr:unnamed protein product [Lactuca saligna]
MGRQGGKLMAAGGGGGGGGASSIALLQERFRQLERMREKREEMEVLKLFPEGQGQSQSQSQTNRYEPPPVRSSVHPRVCFQDSLSLGLNIYTKQTEPQKPAKKQPFIEFLSSKHEVDTSLHL